ncbi:hypothetical protein ACHAP8_009501 [Fusarium lateritium]
MDSTNSPTRVVQTSGQEQHEPHSPMLNVHIYDVSSIQERLYCGAEATTNSPEAINGTTAVSTKLNVLKSQIINIDMVMGTSARIPSRM